MLNTKQKIDCFKKYLEIKNDNYGDTMKDEIYFHFFENENSFDFLNSLESKKSIENKIDLLISKMIMHEHEDGLVNIIYNYV